LRVDSAENTISKTLQFANGAKQRVKRIATRARSAFERRENESPQAWARGLQITSKHVGRIARLASDAAVHG